MGTYYSRLNSKRPSYLLDLSYQRRVQAGSLLLLNKFKKCSWLAYKYDGLHQGLDGDAYT